MVTSGFIFAFAYLAFAICTTVTSSPLTTPENNFEQILVDIIGVPQPPTDDAEGKVSDADIYRLINEFQNQERLSSSQTQGNEPFSQVAGTHALPGSPVTAQQSSTSSKSSPVTSQKSDTSSKSSSATPQQSSTSSKSSPVTSHQSATSSKFSEGTAQQSAPSSKFSEGTPRQSGVSSKSSSEMSQSTDSSVKVAESGLELDITTVLIIGVVAAGLLVILTVVVIAVLLCRKKGKKDFSLNKDLHTWDPQVLRPEKKDIDAFIFGRPIPTVEEMIKQ